MKICKDAGASYVIITAKHHDGFCLWDTKSTSQKSTNYTSKIDIVDRFCSSARKHGLRVGIYYSWYEFEQTCTKKYMDSCVELQIDELSKFKPDIWWFDGDWALTTKYAQNKAELLCNKLKLMNPNVEINDRIGLDPEKKKDINYLGNSTYRVYGDREIPSVQPLVKWEHVNTIGLSWGYNKEQTAFDYKSADQLYAIYRKVIDKAGRFLINIGPKADGTLDDTEVEIIKEFAQVLPSD